MQSIRIKRTLVLVFILICVPMPSRGSQRFLITDADGFSSGTIRDVALSTDGKLLAVAGAKQVRVWNVQTGTLLASIRGYQLAPYLKLGRANGVTFSPDGKHLIVGVSDNTKKGSTRIYRMDRLDELEELKSGHTACTDRVAFSLNGKYFSTYG